ncbi:MAG: BrxA/BrxB family bacilliredoxin [Ignavibacteria bacterium]|jgi:putative YphP/YqiW family bacilliredoxin
MFKLNINQPIYDPVAVQPMRDELIAAGFTEMPGPDDVERFLDIKDKTILVMINSVCGCAAGSARPGVTMALQNSIIPDYLVTVFAGQDREAVDYFRRIYLMGIPPSSPFIVIIKNDEILYMMQRHDIEGKSPEMVAEELVQAFDRYCNRKGPSISTEEYANLQHAIMCGSKIPLAKQNNNQ